MSSHRPVQLPEGQQTISVKLINPVNFGPAILKRFMAPDVPGLETFKTSPSLCFLLEHPSGRKLVWDLGIRKDYNNYAPSITSYLPTTNYNIEVTKNVVDILEEAQVAREEVEAVIWRLVLFAAFGLMNHHRSWRAPDHEYSLTYALRSHWHWDHIGDPSTFPTSTDLIVGPGFKDAMLPGAPANPESPILEADYA